MNELMVIIATGLVFAYFVKFKDGSYYNGGYAMYRAGMYLIPLTLVLAVYAGLRTGYNDTGTYLAIYNSIDVTNGIWNNVSFNLGAIPGFTLVNNILKINNVSSQNFLMIYALFTITVYIWFIHKYSNDFVFSMFLFFTMGCYLFSFAAIKQTTAIAIAFIGVDRALERKWIQYVFFTIIASTFHPYAFLFFMVPILMFRPWSERTYILLFIFLVVGVMLQRLMGTIIDITTMVGSEYDVKSFAGEGVNIFRVLVCSVPIVISYIFRKQLFRNSSKKENLMLNLSMLNAEIMFVGLFGTANYFARLANYFLLAQTVSLPWLINKVDEKYKWILKVGAVIGYILYFYYANVISQNFETMFYRVSLNDYLINLFQ